MSIICTSFAPISGIATVTQTVQTVLVSTSEVYTISGVKLKLEIRSILEGGGLRRYMVVCIDIANLANSYVVDDTAGWLTKAQARKVFQQYCCQLVVRQLNEAVNAASDADDDVRAQAKVAEAALGIEIVVMSGVAYYCAAETNSWWRLCDGDLALAVEVAERQPEDAYSHWCAESSCVELSAAKAKKLGL